MSNLRKNPKIATSAKLKSKKLTIVKPRNSRPSPIDLSHKAKIDFGPLERLLACLVDGHASKHKNRPNRIRDAHTEITGTVVNRLDEPDSEISKSLFAYSEAALQNARNQIAEDHGGPTIHSEDDEASLREKADYALVTKMHPEGSDELDPVYKRVRGTYRGIRKVDRIGYTDAIRAWACDYDDAGERELYNDMKQIASVMAKHGVPMNLEKVFWRVTLKK